jgi:hypothetical protein
MIPLFIRYRLLVQDYAASSCPLQVPSNLGTLLNSSNERILCSTLENVRL